MPEYINFQASRFNVESGRVVAVDQAATSLRDQRLAGQWQRRLEPWILEGGPLGSAYLDFGGESAFLRWRKSQWSQAAWDQALVLIGDSARLSGTYALELPALDQPRYTGTGPNAAEVTMPAGPTGSQPNAVVSQARSPAAIAALVPALADALNDERRVVLPWAGRENADATMWGLLTILRLTGDPRPVSFRTYATGRGFDGDNPGLLVTFRPDVTEPQPRPEHGFAVLAGDLAARFAEDPAALARLLAGLRGASSRHKRIAGLLSLPLSQPFARAPRPSPPPAPPPSPPPAPAAGEPSFTILPRTEPGASDGGGKAAMPVNRGPGGATVMCPVCLADINDWDAQDYYRPNPVPDADDVWQKIEIPADLSAAQRKRYLHNAYVRCEKGTQGPHHLPARYGQFGEPVLLGFVGLTESGKSHLLTTMIGRIEGLSQYEITVEPLDPPMHKRFIESAVEPLITKGVPVPGTGDQETAMRDAFIVRYRNGPERVVALFDVSGGDLADTGMGREFLWIADGLFFVIDPEHIARSKVGDVTFGNVLSIVRDREKPGPKGAAIILNKADKGRFEEPAARWLRSGEGMLDPVGFLRESADVYAYLQRNDALALAAPYEAATCEKVTLHVASPTGGPKDLEENRYTRGVTPTRVLRPLLAMLAMTGVLTDPQAELIGV